ncbi:polyprenyl synthetase family protein [Gammaproteobacteria bacterium]|nr:polyprenyl synthetase family protein [Gammaproteobacteria bacterium]
MIKEIQTDLQSELMQVDQLIHKATESEVGLIQQIRESYIKQPDRKLMRPTVILLSAQCIGFENEYVITLAALIEMMHLATLLHDDVIDNASTRRNLPSMYAAYGSRPAVLMGDFLYGCAFKVIADLESTAITSKIANATKHMIEGEILQFGHRRNPNMSLDDYNFIIDAKTACLFTVGNQCLEILTKQSTNSLSKFAWHLGMAYQITDDILDIDTDNRVLNKEHGKDLTDGLVTLPIIMARKLSTKDEVEVLDKVILGEKPWQDALPIIKSSKAIEHCQKIVYIHLQKAKSALNLLPQTSAKQHLHNLIDNLPKRRK